MGRELKHIEIEELLGAYALDAVDADEAEVVSLHLVDCPKCRAEVIDHREAAAVLAHAGATAPEGVWDRIASSLVEQPPSLDMARILPMRPPQSSRRSLPVRVMAGITAVAAAAVIVLGAQVVSQNHRVDKLAAAVGTRRVDEGALSASFEPGARVVNLKSSDGKVNARAVVTRDGRGYMTQGSMPALKGDQTYQLWGLVADRMVSLGVLGPDPRVVQFEVVGDVKALAVTNEAAGGAVQATKPPVVQGFLPTA